MKKFLIVGASVTVLLVLILITLLLAPPFLRPVVVPMRDYLLHTATSLVSDSINGSIEVGTLQGSLFRAPVIQDVVLRDDQGQRIGRIDEIRLRYDLSTLLEKRLQVHEITLIRPDITLTQEADGSLNLSRAVAPAEPEAVPPESSESAGLPIEIDLASLQLRDGHMTIQHAAVPGVRTVTGIQLQLRGKLTADETKIELQRLQAQTRPAQVKLHTLRGTIQQHNGAIRVAGLQLKTDASAMRANGTLPGGTEPASLRLRLAPLDVGEIGRILNDETLEGLLHLSLDTSGPADDLEVQSQLRTPSGAVDLRGRVDMVNTPPQYEGELDITALDLAALIHRQTLQSNLNLHLDVNGKGLALADLEGELRLQINPSHVGEIQINRSQLHVDAAAKRFQIQDMQVDTSVAHMAMNGTLDLAGKTNLTYALQANISGLQRLLGVEPLQGTLRLRGRAQGDWSDLTTQGTVAAHNIRYQTHGLDALNLAYRASQLLTQPQANVQLKAQQAHVGAIPVAAMTLEATYDDAAGEMHFSSQIQQSEAYDSKLRGRLKLEDERQTLHMDTFQVRLDDHTWKAPEPLDIALERGAVQINAFKLTHEDEILMLTGGIAGSRLNDLHLRAGHIDLDFIRRLLTLPELISGEATWEARLTGTLETPRLHSELTVLLQQQKPTPLARLHTTIDYAGHHFQGEVHAYQHDQEVMTLSAQLPLQLSATAMPLAERLLPDPLAIQLVFQRPDLSALQHSLPNLPALSGTMQGTIDLQGTYAHLDVDANLALEQVGLPGTIEQVSAPLHLTSRLIMAPSVSALGLALEQGTLNPALHVLTFRVPKLDGTLPSPSQPPQSLHLRDLLAEAEGEWLPKGMQVSLNTLRFQVEGLGLPPTHVAMTGQLTPIDLELTGLQIQLPRSEIRAQGRLDLSTQGLNVAVDIPRLQLDELPLTLPDTWPKTVQGDLTIRGTTQRPELAADLRYAKGRINADAVAALQASPPAYRAKVVANALDVSHFVPHLKGYLTTQLTLDGVGFTAQERKATLALDLQTQEVAVAPGLTARVRANVEGAAVQLKTLQVDSAPVTFAAQGELTHDERVTFNYTLDLKDLTPLREQLALEVAAHGRMSGEVTGAMEALQARANLRLNDWQYTSMQGQDVRVDLTAQGLPASPQATVQARFEGIKGPSLPSSTLTLEAQYRNHRGDFDITVADGPFEHSRVAGHAVLQDGQQLTLQTLRFQRDDWLWENTKPVDISHDSNGVLRLEGFHLRHGDQALRIQGHLQPGGPLAVSAQMQRLQIQPAAQALAPQTNVPNGRLNVDLNLSGTQSQPEMNGTLRLDDLQWQEQTVGNIEATVQLRDNTLRHEMQLRHGQTELFSTQGTLGLGDPGKLAVTVQSNDFDLARLKPFSSEIQDITGALSINLRLAGTLTKPEAHGDLVLDQGALQLETTGEPYKDIRAHLHFDRHRVNIETLHVGSSRGHMQLQGVLHLAGLALDQLDLKLDANNFTAMNTPSIEAVVTADIKASGSQQALTVNGNVAVPRARIRLDELPGMGPGAVRPEDLSVEAVYGSGAAEASGTSENDGSAANTRDPLPFLRADLKVDIPRNAWLQARGTAIELKGNLDVTKPYSHPLVIGGEVATLRGHATFFGKKFDLETGVITFTGSEDINPSLDVTASHRVADYTVYVDLEGESKAPSLTLSSDPELEQQDIIALLLFGKTSDRLTESEGTLSDKAQQAAANAAAGAAAQVIGREIGIDSLDIKAGNTPSDASVRAGQYITQDLFLSYERQFGKEGGNTIGVEYNLGRQLLLKGSSSDLGESALDLLWRRDY